MAKINDLTGQTNAYLMARVNKAYTAAFGKKAPKLTLTAPVEDPTVLGRVHFGVRQGTKLVGSGMYKPRHGSIWVVWK